jgi:hypothetical protein
MFPVSEIISETEEETVESKNNYKDKEDEEEKEIDSQNQSISTQHLVLDSEP